MAPDLQSFSDSLDEPRSPFYTAPGRTPNETWDLARARMIELVAEVGLKDASQIVVSVDQLRTSHQRIFGDLFPEDARRFRWKQRGKWETGPFGVGVGSGPQSAVRPMRGVHPRRIGKQLQHAFREFQQTLSNLEVEGKATSRWLNSLPA